MLFINRLIKLISSRKLTISYIKSYINWKIVNVIDRTNDYIISGRNLTQTIPSPLNDSVKRIGMTGIYGSDPFTLGNHEWYFSDEEYSLFKDHGITVLDNADVEVVIKGKQIRIGGLSTRFDMNWLREYSRKAGYKILLCHHPEYYRKMIMNTEFDTFNLVLGGHYHGGQWRVFNRAVFVPRIGFMMTDAVGQFGKLIISSGVANTSGLPRFGNPCELVVIET